MYTRNSIFCVPNPCLEVSVPRLTHYLAHDDDGNLSVHILEKDIHPLSSLNWDDFSLERLVKSGVNIKSLGISTDLRIGFDSEIDAFNERLMSISDKLFNVESKS